MVDQTICKSSTFQITNFIMDQKFKYYRITANSMTSYEYYIKVPDTITEQDIWDQRGDYVLDGANFSAIDNGWGGVGDWEYDEVIEVDENEAKEESFDEWDEEAFKK